MRVRGAVIGLASVGAFLVLWQLAPGLGWVDGRLTSQPSLVAVAAVQVFRDDGFLYHAGISLTEFVLGFALAILVSVPLGIALGVSRLARELIEPPLMALYMAPTLILLPIMIVWLGIGMESKVAVVFLGAVFPIVVNTVAGMRQADVRLVRMARIFGASRLDVFWRILVPGALPAFAVGLRLAVGRAVLGVVVGELFASQAGIGFQLMSYGQAMRTDRLLVYALVVSLFGYGLTLMVRLLETRLLAWRPQ